MATKQDPLEQAKISSTPKAPSAPPEAARVADPVDAAADSDEPAAPALVHPRYTVMADQKVSLGGMICMLKAGQVIDSAGYGGAPGIDKLQRDGLKLELVK